MPRFQLPSIRSGFAAGLLLGVLALPAVAALAAEEGGLEEIVVTAQKREESIQNVGISMTAYSADQLKDLGISNTTQITQQVPGLQLTTWTPAFTIFSLRGVSQNNFQDNLEAPVAVYVDGAYVASMNAVNGQLFDMDRVEVLRGPQGTLFGRNATGGLIQFITHKATDREFNGYAQIGGGEFGTRSAEAAMGGAFTDRVRARIAARYEHSDGYIKPGTAFGVTAHGGNAGGANGFAVRGSLQADITDQTLFDLTAAYSRDHDVPTGQYIITLVGYDPNTGLGSFHNAVDPANPGAGPVNNYSRTPITGSPWRHWSNEFPYFDRDSKSATAQFTSHLGGVEFVSITNWLKMHKYYIEDSSGGFGYFPYNTVADYDQWSEELRLSGGTNPFRWQVGAYYLHMKWDTYQSVAGALILSALTDSNSDTQKMSTYGNIGSRNWSVFGQVEYDLTPSLTAIAGARWSQDNKDISMWRIYEDVPGGVPPTEVFNINNVAIPGIKNIDYGDYAARAQLNWKPLEKTLFYLAFNRGIKGGNWSLDPLGAVANEALKHGPEKLYAYEVGSKTDFPGGKVRLNTALFYYDYKGYQAFSLVGLTPQVANSDATAHGGEIELTVAPTRGLNVSLGAEFLNSRVDAVPDVYGGTVEAKLPTAPAVSLNGLVRYEWPMLGGYVAAQVDGRWNDSQFLEGTNSDVSYEPSYGIWNASLSYRPASDKLNVSVWVKNASNTAYRMYDLDLGQLGFIEQAFGPPRQFGGDISYRW